MLGFPAMSLPVIDNFEPFRVEHLAAIRSARITDLSDPDYGRKTKKRSGLKGPRLDMRAKKVIAGLDPETQRILQQLLAKK